MRKLVGANAIAVVGSPDKEALVREFGASMVINRSGFDFSKGMEASRAFGAEIRKLTGGRDPDIVFEHVWQGDLSDLGPGRQASSARS